MKKIKCKLKKKGKVWHGAIIKDEDHNYTTNGTNKAKVLAKLKKVARELGWKIDWGKK